MKRTIVYATVLGLALAYGAILLLGGGTASLAAPAAGIQVCSVGCAFSTIQAAVDAADPGETIKVASNVYSDLHVRGGVTQVVYISKTVIVRGGYTADFTQWDPDTYYTTIDPQGKGRGVYISGYGIRPVVEGFYIKGGDAAGLKGDPWGEDAGGGVYVNSAVATINRCVIEFNTAYRGGGLFANAPVTLTRNTFFSNTANSGGGIYLATGGAYNVHGNVVLSNTASGDGGGMMLNGGDTLLINNVLADNRCGNRGSGVLVYGASIDLVHTTIARNSGGDGAGVTVADPGFAFSNVGMTNTIVSEQSEGVRVMGGSTATLHSTLWHSTATAGSGNIAISSNYLGDPAFAADGYHLTVGSAAIDKGLEVDVWVDLDGGVRPAGMGWDLGADEAPAKIYLPLVLR